MKMYVAGNEAPIMLSPESVTPVVRLLCELPTNANTRCVIGAVMMSESGDGWWPCSEYGQ